MNNPQKIVYVTANEHKKDENRIFREMDFDNRRKISDVVEFHIQAVPIKETLEVDIGAMVKDEAADAYRNVRVPCIVEHAGLVFEDYEDAQYPGGLTKPMWNALGEHFVEETNAAGRRAIARAVVAYCDGTKVLTFVGERRGKIANTPRGSREFYWDTIFVPDSDEIELERMTYAEIVDSDEYGLEYKVKNLSQSTAAMRGFVEHVAETAPPRLWPHGFY
jgi:inosine/xanthosine triphosphate pyrophosphatase family protein